MHFKDGRELISQNRRDEYKARICRLQRGDAIDFGRYELSGTVDPNDVHVRIPITWLVLSKKRNDILLLSEKALYWDFFDGSGHREPSSWESFYVRHELNTEKMQEYFIAEERSLIKGTVLKGDYNPVYYTYSNYNVTDYLFLLTAEDVAKYLLRYDPADGSLAQLGLRDKAKATILFADQSGTADEVIEVSEYFYPWWLRTVGGIAEHMAVVSEDGRIDLRGVDSDADEIGIRPAMWIGLNHEEDE